MALKEFSTSTIVVYCVVRCPACFIKRKYNLQIKSVFIRYYYYAVCTQLLKVKFFFITTKALKIFSIQTVNAASKLYVSLRHVHQLTRIELQT